MLVLSREAGASIHIGSTDVTCVVTILKLLPERRAVTMLVNSASVSRPGELDCRTFELAGRTLVRISGSFDVTLVDLKDDKVRIGITVPKAYSVHRLEVYEAIHRQKLRGNDTDDGMAGSPIPRPSSPNPPSLEMRLAEPPLPDSGV